MNAQGILQKLSMIIFKNHGNSSKKCLKAALMLLNRLGSE